MIIIDLGSGNSCRNDLEYAKRMVREIAGIDSHQKEVVLKWQLFEKVGDNIPLDRELFAKVHHFATELGYDTAASVFDNGSLEYLLRFDIPFVKIANRPDLYWLAERVPEEIGVIKSVPSPELFTDNCLCCVSKYPATMKQYERIFPEDLLRKGISDHTINWDLYLKYQPELYECHFVIEHDETNLDGGSFARTPTDLAKII